jgi:hypothetical protein
MSKTDFIIRLLTNHNWGLFYKNKPIEQLTLQNDSPLFKVNEVNLESVEKAIRELIEKEDTECKDTTQQSQGSQNTPLESG